MKFGAGAAALAALLAAGSAGAQQGSQSVGATSSGNYANNQRAGGGDLAAISRLPGVVAPLPVPLKVQGARFLKGKTRVAVATYGLQITRSGEASAYAGGRGSDVVGRRASISTTLSGISDELAQSLAGEAYDDLVNQLRAGGYDPIPYAELSAAPGFAEITSSDAKVVVGGSHIYAPAGKPLKTGGPVFQKLAMSNQYNKIVETIPITIVPGLMLDYENIGGSGNRIYGGTAEVGAKLRFHIMPNSGAIVYTKSGPPYRGNWAGLFYNPQGAGTDEPFAVMTLAQDRSDSRALATGMALMGLGNNYRQHQIYTVNADPKRYAALVRAAFKGMNASIVSELKRVQAAEK